MMEKKEIPVFENGIVRMKRKSGPRKREYCIKLERKFCFLASNLFIWFYGTPHLKIRLRSVYNISSLIVRNVRNIDITSRSFLFLVYIPIENVFYVIVSKTALEMRFINFECILIYSQGWM